jgi:hypothetical protein
MTDKRSALVDKIANIVSDYYDEDAAGRWRKCAQHIADSLTGQAANDLADRLEAHARNADYSSSSFICFEAAAALRARDAAATPSEPDVEAIARDMVPYVGAISVVCGEVASYYSGFNLSEFARRLLDSTHAAQQPPVWSIREALDGVLAWTGATRIGITDPEERMAFEDDLKIAQKISAALALTSTNHGAPSDAQFAADMADDAEMSSTDRGGK